MSPDATRQIGGVRVRYDPVHLQAHLPDLALSLDQALALLVPALPRGRQGVFSCVVQSPQLVGWSGCVRLRPDDRAWWAPRPGRDTLSHLVDRPTEPTHHLCAWGQWLAPDTFELFTLYAGDPAPKEIHDPTLRPEEVDEALAFWAEHALAVGVQKT